MKNIQFTSRETDSQVLAALAFVGFFALAGVFSGFFMPWPAEQMPYLAFILAAISVGLAVFVWSIFRLIKPLRYNRGWNLAEVIAVPFYWLLLLITVDVWLGGAVDIDALQSIVGTLQ